MPRQARTNRVRRKFFPIITDSEGTGFFRRKTGIGSGERTEQPLRTGAFVLDDRRRFPRRAINTSMSRMLAQLSTAGAGFLSKIRDKVPKRPRDARFAASVQLAARVPNVAKRTRLTWSNPYLVTIKGFL